MTATSIPRMRHFNSLVVVVEIVCNFTACSYHPQWMTFSHSFQPGMAIASFNSISILLNGNEEMATYLRLVTGKWHVVTQHNTTAVRVLYGCYSWRERFPMWM